MAGGVVLATGVTAMGQLTRKINVHNSVANGAVTGIKVLGNHMHRKIL